MIFYYLSLSLSMFCNNLALTDRNIKLVIFFFQLKPTMKTEGDIHQTTAQGNKEEINTHTPPTGSASGGNKKSRKSKHKRLMQQAVGTVDGKLS